MTWSYHYCSQRIQIEANCLPSTLQINNTKNVEGCWGIDLDLNCRLVQQQSSTLDRAFPFIGNEARIIQHSETKQRGKRLQGRPYRFTAQKLIWNLTKGLTIKILTRKEPSWGSRDVLFFSVFFQFVSLFALFSVEEALSGVLWDQLSSPLNLRLMMSTSVTRHYESPCFSIYFSRLCL